MLLVGGVGALVVSGAALAGSVDGPLRPGHLLMFAVISLSTLGAAAVALARPGQPVARSALGVAMVATLFFALGNAVLIIPLGLLPSWLALASTGFDVLLPGVAVAVWDAFDEGQALRADMLRSFAGSMAAAVLFGGQALIGLALTRRDPTAQAALTVLLFSTLAIAVAVQVLTDPLAGVDDETFVRLTRRALGHYGDRTKLVASPLTALPVIDERLAARGAPDQPLERANELKAVLADAIARLKPRDAGDFGTTEQWCHYNSLYFPYVAGVRAYAQNATASGLDPTARRAWQWLVTEVP